MLKTYFTDSEVIQNQPVTKTMKLLRHHTRSLLTQQYELNEDCVLCKQPLKYSI